MEGDGWHARRSITWFSDDVQDFVDEPHTAIAAETIGDVWTLVAHERAAACDVTAELAREQPEKVVAEIVRLRELTLPAHADVRGPMSSRAGSNSGTDLFGSDPVEVLTVDAAGPGTVRVHRRFSHLLQYPLLEQPTPPCGQHPIEGSSGIAGRQRCVS